MSTGIITSIAGISGNGSYSGDGGAATSATLHFPYGVALDSAGNSYALLYFIINSYSFFLGNIFIADLYNNRVRKVTVSTGIITTIAGTGTLNYSGDGGEATSATLQYPNGVALDAAGKSSCTKIYSYLYILLIVSFLLQPR